MDLSEASVMKDMPSISNIRAAWRSVGILLITLILVLMYLPSVLRRNVPFGAISRWHRCVCFVTGLKVTVLGTPKIEGAVMYVCNHVSYIDIPILGKILEAYFVAKSDVRQWSGFGYLAELSHTVFIERKGRKSLEQRERLVSILEANKRVILFPEGTSSNGAQVLPFKSTLFEAAFVLDKSEVSIQPVTIGYRSFDGKLMTRRSRDLCGWYGDMELAGHLWRWLGIKSTHVVVSFHPTASCSEHEDRKKMALYCEEKVAAGLVQILS